MEPLYAVGWVDAVRVRGGIVGDHEDSVTRF
jgi:hypothetical protein